MLLWHEDIPRSDWLLLYLMRTFNFISLFHQLHQLVNIFASTKLKVIGHNDS